PCSWPDKIGQIATRSGDMLALAHWMEIDSSSNAPRHWPPLTNDNSTGSSALSTSATTASATATTDGRSGAATQTTQMISQAVCALTTLAFLLDAARWAANADADADASAADRPTVAAWMARE